MPKAFKFNSEINEWLAEKGVITGKDQERFLRRLIAIMRLKQDSWAISRVIWAAQTGAYLPEHTTWGRRRGIHRLEGTDEYRATHPRKASTMRDQEFKQSMDAANCKCEVCKGDE